MRTSPPGHDPGGRPRRRRGAPWSLLLATATVAALVVAAGGAATPDRADATTGGDSGADGGGRIDPTRPRLPQARSTPDPAPSPPSQPVAVREVVGPAASLAPEGWLVAGGGSPVAGATGPLVTYTVEVAVPRERGVDPNAVAADVVATLADAERGWTATGAWRIQRVDDPEDAHLRVLLAEPAVVDELCADAGLDTRGYFSCFNGEFAALNADRWLQGVPHVPDLALYRTYLVNHEVGHGLGYQHERCRAEGALAPVMMQLTVSDEGCIPNGVPFP